MSIARFETGGALAHTMISEKSSTLVRYSEHSFNPQPTARNLTKPTRIPRLGKNAGVHTRGVGRLIPICLPTGLQAKVRWALGYAGRRHMECAYDYVRRQCMQPPPKPSKERGFLCQTPEMFRKNGTFEIAPRLGETIMDRFLPPVHPSQATYRYACHSSLPRPAV